MLNSSSSDSETEGGGASMLHATFQIVMSLNHNAYGALLSYLSKVQNIVKTFIARRDKMEEEEEEEEDDGYVRIR